MSSIFSGSTGRKALMFMLVLMCGLACVAPVHAEEAEATNNEGDIIGSLLEFGAWFTPFHRTNAFRGLQREIDDQVGILVTLGGTLTWQIASDVEMGDNNLFNGSYDLAGEWAFLDTDLGKSILKFGIEGGFNIGANKSEDLSANVGSILGINADYETDELKVGDVFWAQTLFDNQLTVIFGRSSGDTFIDDNRVAADETSQFLSNPLKGNPTIPGPDKGMTVAASWTINDSWYFAGGISDATAIESQSGFDTLDDDKWFSSGEIGMATDFNGLAGTYRAYAWYTDVVGANGAGVGVSFDQELPWADGLVAFFRGGWADDSVADFSKFLSGGLAIEGPLGREGDMTGIGVAWGDPSDTSLNDETLIEAFYRYQINQYVEISPDVQWVINPGDSTADSVFLFGLRLQITYGGPDS